MSLIDEALKKTQSSIYHQQRTPHAPPITETKNTVHAAATQMPYSAHILNRHKIRANPTKIFAVLFIVLIVFLGGELVAHIKNIAARYDNFYGALFAPTAKKTPQKVAIAAPINTAVLTLDGIVEEGKTHDALINGTLYHLNDTVDGYRIAQIHFNNVTLEDPVTHQKQVLTVSFS